ncbi:ATP-dependent metallopeptidase FtsH/Yme1/Tma family protein [bacterium]|jgi:cell division protease FtsH|nr:ATP-dependent metallopeptidase FtsH/Yme1/Tma family protein [bacterium]
MTTKPPPPEGASKPKKPRDWRNLLWYILITFIVISLVSANLNEPKAPEVLDYSAFLQQLESGKVKEVTVRTSDRAIVGLTKEDETFKTFYLDTAGLMTELRAQEVKVDVNPTDSGWMWGMVLQALLPFILIGCLWFFIFRQASGMGNQAMSFGKSKAKPWNKLEHKRITFKDVAGVDEAVEELHEIVDFLKAPKKYTDIGAKIPKGMLLMGPPGTGKTLLAKAVAGEADVPFFSISGSDFVEMFVGVGASRVRDLFAQAKKQAPAIIFLDEIDAVGRHRGAGLGGGHDEREQTLNQLLVEMDGFEGSATVIVIAATNRADVLDPALLRPGRFDRQVTVDKPDIKGRHDILKIHAKKKKIARSVNLETIAKGTAGFTGADLANLMNEAALLAARHGKKTLGTTELEEAVERVIAGPQRKSRVMVEKEKEIVAYHEVGHALVAAYCDKTNPVHKISILPRGRALGYTLQLPDIDKHLISRTEILSQMKTLLGGRIAEDITFNEITSGASNDIERVTELARQFVCVYGMSDKLGPRKYGSNGGEVFLGRQMSDNTKEYSESTANAIDEEIQTLITEAYADATKILTDHRDQLESVSQALIKKEVIEGNDFLKMIGLEVKVKKGSVNEEIKTDKSKVTKSAKITKTTKKKKS